MSAKPEAEAAVKAPAKSKKLLILVGGAVLILALAGGGAYMYIAKQRAAAAAEEGADSGEAAAKEERAAPKTPPVYLPLDNMVVNLADPGGERVAQVGVILETTDAKASDSVKAYLPTIRSAVLLLISRRTAEELLTPAGKEQLAKDILAEALRPFGGAPSDEDKPAPAKKAKAKGKDAHGEMPVTGVLFSSFIVQ